MPKRLERKLNRRARRMFPGDKERQDRYVYGTMNKLGLLHKENENARTESTTRPKPSTASKSQ